MTTPAAPIRDISDTARWAAAFRATENRRADALFSDPFAARLAGERGTDAQSQMPSGSRHAWAWVTRTWLFDQFIQQQVAAGADTVINLAAGLDTRPYRMNLPASLKWIEVDLPTLLAYKQDVLDNETPRCSLQRVPLDLSNVAARRELFQSVAQAAENVLVITEGLLIYLENEQVASLAQDLAAAPSFRNWIIDLTSPGLLRILQKNLNKSLAQAGAPLKFGPEAGVAFFEPFGWRAVGVRPILKTAARLKRLPLLLRLVALFPEPKDPPGAKPWSGVCLLEKQV